MQNVEDIIQLLFDLIPHTAISSHVPGKITVKFDLSVIKKAKGLTPKDLKMPGIRKTKIRYLSRRITIEYDPNTLPFDFWESLIRLKEESDRKPEIHSRLKEVFKTRPAQPAN